MTMSEATKARLREIAAEKRKANPVPTDYAETDWLVAREWAEERTGEVLGVGKLGAYLKFGAARFQDALAAVVPHRTATVSAGPGRTREVKVFCPVFLRAVLEFLRLPWTKYLGLLQFARKADLSPDDRAVLADYRWDGIAARDRKKGK